MVDFAHISFVVYRRAHDELGSPMLTFLRGMLLPELEIAADWKAEFVYEPVHEEITMIIRFEVLKNALRQISN